jgi:hypothetical protein
VGDIHAVQFELRVFEILLEIGEHVAFAVFHALRAVSECVTDDDWLLAEGADENQKPHEREDTDAAEKGQATERVKNFTEGNYLYTFIAKNLTQ